MKKIINTSLKKAMILIIVLGYNNLCFSQNDDLNLQKYWYYRDRLKYFVVPGTAAGESQIIGIRNNAGKYINAASWGQHGVHFGYYLGVLATEYYLLSSFNQDCSQTINELSLALNAYVEQMDKCEQDHYGVNDSFDGFFVRNNIDYNMNFVSSHSQQLNQNLTSNDAWSNFKDGRPGWIDCELGSQSCPDDGSVNYLLSSFNQDCSQTINELSLALNAYVEQMDKCEQDHYGVNDSFDGFFVRNNIDYNMNFVSSHSQQLNQNLTSNDTWSHFKDGRPGWIDCELGSQSCPDDGSVNYWPEPMSQDEAIGLLKGLSLVFRCLPENSNEKNLSKEIALKIITKMWGLGTWVIREPDGNIVELGGYVSTYAYSLSKCAEYFGQDHLSFWYTTDLAAYQSRRFSWQAMQYAGWGSSNNSMTTTIAAICNCWTAENNNPMFGHLLNTTDESLNFIGGLDDWDSFYLMQWEFLQNKRTPYLNKDDAKVMIAMAPCEGPYCWSVGNNRAFGGWASTYRFERDFQTQSNGEGLGFEGVYHGLDYMLLYNLYYITELRDWKDGFRNGKLLPPYINIKNWTSDQIAYPYKNISNHLNPGLLTGNENIPYYAYGFSTIESSATVDNVCHIIDQTLNNNYSYTQTGTNCFGNVTYRAGEKITLKQGFTVKPGAYFRAFVEPFHCQCIDYTNTVNNFNYGIESLSDSSISLYYYSKYHDDFQPNKPNDIYLKDSVILTSDDNCKIFPNPFTDKFNVEYSVKGSSDINISLVSENGTKLKETIKHQSTLGTYSETINCSDFAPGVYYCMIKTKEYCSAIKILKTR